MMRRLANLLARKVDEKLYLGAVVVLLGYSLWREHRAMKRDAKKWRDDNE